MRFEPMLFGSRVARRVFALFILAGLLPLAIVILLAFARVGTTLEDRAFTDLERVSRVAGQQLLDRLLVARELLSSVPRVAAGSASVAFDAAFVRSPDGTEWLFGAADDFEVAQPPLDAQRASVLLRFGEHGGDIYLARPAGRELLVGRLDPDFLWRAAGEIHYGFGICVFARGASTALFCSEPLPDAAKRVLAEAPLDRSGGRLTWTHDGERWLSSYWELFLPSRFAAEPWLIVVSQPRKLALESLYAFNRAVPQAIALTVILVLLLSITQIRRTLGPLNQLVAGTVRIANRHFGARVAVDTDDEFGDLARAMNGMAERLGQQFDTLTALAEIDRVILSSQGIDHVLEAVLARASSILPAGDLSVLLLDPDQRNRARLYSQSSDHGQSVTLRRIEIAQELSRRLAEQPHGIAIDAASLRQWCTEPEAAREQGSAAEPGSVSETSGAVPRLRNDDVVFILPMFRGEALHGALLARFESATLAAAASDQLQEIAGRFAVAIAAAEREQELFERAYFDSLTGLPNRQLCSDRLGQALARARRDGHKLAVFFIDLDGFKNINDSLGHSVGDDVLRETAVRLRNALRETDTVARLGGDEYVVILPHVEGPFEVEDAAERILASIKRPFLIQDSEAFVTASIGATLFPDDGDSAEELLRKADTAMYGAKDQGRARCVFFAAAMDRHVHERLALQTDLRHALEKGEMFLLYQPQVDLETQRVTGAEALLRWRHPERGIVSPVTFVPLLEETGLIESVGAWVLQTALADFASWQSQGLPIERVAVNVAARQLFAPYFATFVVDCLRISGVRPSCLELELTESTLVQDFESSNAVLRRLRASGIHVAVDDFGTGYSSLGYLKDLVFDTVKIDRAFVSNLPEEKSVAIVKAILAVASALGKDVVAEGIETEPQHDHLRRLGCPLGQGFLFARPLTAPALAAWLTNLSQAADTAAVTGASRN
jgi:diguanylate cyclase (GGDEF)-like protein